MIRRDYILDLIEQCAALVLAAVGLKKAEAAEAELADALTAWTGLDLDMATTLPHELLVQMLGAGEVGAAERLLLVGEALALRCLLARKRGEAQTALALQAKAVRLVDEALQKSPELMTPSLGAILTALYE